MATIDNLKARLTTPYLNDDDSNNVKLLQCPAEQKDDLQTTRTDIGEAQNVEQSTGIQLDQLGELIACFRHTDESDADYRKRMKDWLHSLIGGGTVAQLEHTIRMAIPGIADDEFEIIDGYPVSGHGDPNHYAHIKVRIDVGFDWVINNLWEMLQKARAACITIDEMGPLVAETLTLGETITIEFPGYFYSEDIVLGEEIVLEIDLGTISDEITWTEPVAGSNCHFADITYTESINIICA